MGYVITLGTFLKLLCELGGLSAAGVRAKIFLKRLFLLGCNFKIPN